MRQRLNDDDRGQVRGLVGLMIGFLISAIVALEVVIPVISDGINSVAGNVSGSAETILNLLPLFVALLLLVGIAGPLLRRF